MNHKKKGFLIIPKLYFCKKCKIIFFSKSKLINPTHSKCHTHNTRLATKEEYNQIITKKEIDF